MPAHRDQLDGIASGEPILDYSEALRKHTSRHVNATQPITQRQLDFEHRRPRLLQECAAEALGTFFYV